MLLQKQILHLRGAAAQLSGPYQPLNMETFDWHALSHFVDALGNVEDIGYIDTQGSKSCHKKYKR